MNDTDKNTKKNQKIKLTKSPLWCVSVEVQGNTNTLQQFAALYIAQERVGNFLNIGDFSGLRTARSIDQIDSDAVIADRSLWKMDFDRSPKSRDSSDFFPSMSD